MNKTTYGLVAFLLLCILVIVVYVPSVNNKVAEVYQAEVEKYENLSLSLLAASPIDFTVGAEDPKVRLVVYTDTDCPFCKKMEPRFTRLMEEHPGQVAVTYRHFNLPIYPGSRYEHLALECVGILSGAEAYRTFQNDVLLEVKLPPKTAEYTPNAAELVKFYLPELSDSIDDCVNDPETTERIKRKAATGSTLGVRITPTLFYVDQVGNYKMQAGSLVYEKLLPAINDFLGEGNELSSQ